MVIDGDGIFILGRKPAARSTLGGGKCYNKGMHRLIRTPLFVLAVAALAVTALRTTPRLAPPVGPSSERAVLLAAHSASGEAAFLDDGRRLRTGGERGGTGVGEELRLRPRATGGAPSRGMLPEGEWTVCRGGRSIGRILCRLLV